MPRRWPTSPARSRANAATTRAPRCCSGPRPPSRRSRVTAGTLAPAAYGARSLDRRLTTLAATARAMAGEMDFGFLLDPERKLLSIGYRVADGTLDPNCYDLLASEARLASFVAIAKGDVPSRHWFRLGRAADPGRRGAALISWSGSMFEYLMPSLVMRAPAGSLLAQTSRLVVRRRSSTAPTLGVPWGISESAFNVRDIEHTYQYSNFGVPGLGLKRGLGENAVVAPYATALAAMVDPAAAARNFARLAAHRRAWRATASTRRSTTRRHASSRGAKRGDRPRLHGAPPGHDASSRSPTRSLDGAMRATVPCRTDDQATELLLQERPRGTSRVAHRRPRRCDGGDGPRCCELPREPATAPLRTTATPQVHLLSNGRYCGHADGGRFRLQPLARSRRHALARGRDPRRLGLLRLPARRAERRGLVGGLPADAASSRTATRSTFSEDRAEFIRRDGTLTTTTRGRRLGGGRRRGPPRLHHEPGDRARDDRAHVLRGTRAGAARRRRRAPGVLEALRGDGISSPRSARSSRRGAGARPASPKSGRRISRSSKARPWASSSSRPIAPASSAAARRPARRSR